MGVDCSGSDGSTVAPRVEPVTVTVVTPVDATADDTTSRAAKLSLTGPDDGDGESLGVGDSDRDGDSDSVTDGDGDSEAVPDDEAEGEEDTDPDADSVSPMTDDDAVDDRDAAGVVVEDTDGAGVAVSDAVGVVEGVTLSDGVPVAVVDSVCVAVAVSDVDAVSLTDAVAVADGARVVVEVDDAENEMDCVVVADFEVVGEMDAGRERVGVTAGVFDSVDVQDSDLVAEPVSDVDLDTVAVREMDRVKDVVRVDDGVVARPRPACPVAKFASGSPPDDTEVGGNAPVSAPRKP